MSKFSKGNVKAQKLTAEKVLELRVKYSEGQSQGSLAREYGVSVGQVGRIVRGESWQTFQQVEPVQKIEDRFAMMQIKPSDSKINESLAKLASKLAAEQPPAGPRFVERRGDDSGGELILDKLRGDIRKKDPLHDLPGDDE